LSIAGVAALGIGVCGSPLPSALATPMPVPTPLAPGQSSPEQQSMGLTGAPNARDIGGYPTQQGGGKIRYGLVFRSDNLAKLTDADQQKLLTLKIGSVLDFRSPNEVKDSPDKLPPSIPATKLPVWDPNNDFYLIVNKAIAGGPSAQEAVFGGGKNVQFMQDYYRWMVTDANSRAQFAAALNTIANSPTPILYHCTSGKDRTGWNTAILMSALGVPKGQIYQDYLASNDNLAAGNQATIAYLQKQGLVTDPSLLLPIMGVQADYLDAAFDQVQKSYGSFDNFLSQGLGISADTVKALKTKMLNPPGN
jgi:protein-tyrosine phosphatase